MAEASFASRAREEVAGRSRRPCCQESFLMAVVAGAKFFHRYGGAVLRLSEPAVQRAVLKMLERKGITYALRRESGAEAGALSVVELPELPAGYFRLPDLHKACCRRSWMAGLFLVAGTVGDPQKDYYFEWSCGSLDLTYLLGNCLYDEGLHPTVSARGKGQIVCLKRGEEVADALTLVGANRARLEFENVRAVKETTNDLHRLVNAETANIRRTVEAGARQASFIRILKERGVLEGLSQPLAELALLRLDNPELSYRELGELCNPPQTRAVIGKRLARLEKLAAELGDQAGK